MLLGTHEKRLAGVVAAATFVGVETSSKKYLNFASLLIL
jgi:hypothetical protein